MRIALLVLLCGLAVSAIARDKAKSTEAAPANDPYNYTAYTRDALRGHFPDVVLQTQNKKRVRFYKDLIKDRTVVIQFMFTNCDQLCPTTTPNLVRAQRELNKRVPGKVSFLSITVDPMRDTPAALKRYAAQFGVRTGWHFVTGSKDDIDLIRRKLGVYDTDENKVQHMNVLTIGNESQGKWLAMEALAKPEDISQTVLRVLGNPR
jgi:protein SCO1/2